MKTKVLCGAISLLAGSLLASDSDDVKAAVKNLAEKSNYSWRTTVAVPEGGGGGGGRFRPGPTEGKTEKGGYTLLSMTAGESTTEAVVKGDKGAIKVEGEWRTLAEATE